MEEVEQIVLHSLRGLGADIPEDATVLKDLSQQQIYQCVVLAVRAIDDKRVFPKRLPPNMSMRVHTCTELCTAIKEMGYTGELGYHHLLYGGANESQKLLLWLNENLPSLEKSDETAEKTGLDLFQDRLDKEWSELKKCSWTPSFSCGASPHRMSYRRICNFSAQHLRYPTEPPKSSACKDFVTSILPFITKQPNNRSYVVPSILEANLSRLALQLQREEEWNTLGMDSGLSPMEYNKQKLSKIKQRMQASVRSCMADNSMKSSYGAILEDLNARRDRAKRTRFAHQVDFTEKENVVKTVQVSEKDLQQQRAAEIEELDDQLRKTLAEIDRLRKDVAAFEASILQLEANIISEKRQAPDLAEEYKWKKKTIDLLPDAENNIKMLQQISEESMARLKQLAAEWETHRVSALNTYRQLRDSARNVKDDSAEKLEECRKMRAQMKDLSQEIQVREERYKQLLDHYSRLPKDINRGVYTRRILEIVKNVKKQKIDIDKILIDTRALQKEINTITDTLNRSFAVSSELVFKEALSDETAKQAYKDLVAMHEKFDQLSTQVEQTGSIRNNILNLEENVEEMIQRTENLNIKQVSKDLALMKKENAAMVKKIKQGA